MIDFHKITIADKEPFERCAAAYNYYICEHCFTDALIWSGHYGTKLHFSEGLCYTMSISEETGAVFYGAPFGSGNLRQGLQKIRADAEERRVPLRIVTITQPMLERMEAEMPGVFHFEEHRDGSDYLYLAQDLSTLKGKKFQSKRNLINRFKAEYEGRWAYEAMAEENKEEAFRFNETWKKINGCRGADDPTGEVCALRIALDYFSALHLKGGFLRLDGKVIAMTIGCQSYEDLFVIQFEKADAEISGAYQMINQQFAMHNFENVTYVNREEDLGIEGLRKAKLSYHPVQVNMEYVATLKENSYGN